MSTLESEFSKSGLGQVPDNLQNIWGNLLLNSTNINRIIKEHKKSEIQDYYKLSPNQLNKLSPNQLASLYDNSKSLGDTLNITQRKTIVNAILNPKYNKGTNKLLLNSPGNQPKSTQSNSINKLMTMKFINDYNLTDEELSKLTNHITRNDHLNMNEKGLADVVKKLFPNKWIKKIYNLTENQSKELTENQSKLLLNAEDFFQNNGVGVKSIYKQLINKRLARNIGPIHKYGLPLVENPAIIQISMVCGKYLREVLFNFMIQEPVKSTLIYTQDNEKVRIPILDEGKKTGETIFSQIKAYYNDQEKGRNGTSYGGEQMSSFVANFCGNDIYSLKEDTHDIRNQKRKISDNEYNFHFYMRPSGNENVHMFANQIPMIICNTSNVHFEYGVYTNTETEFTTKISREVKNHATEFVPFYLSRIIDSAGNGNCFYNSVALHILYNMTQFVNGNHTDLEKDTELTERGEAGNLKMFKAKISEQVTKLQTAGIINSDYNIDDDLFVKDDGRLLNELSSKYSTNLENNCIFSEHDVKYILDKLAIAFKINPTSNTQQVLDVYGLTLPEFKLKLGEFVYKFPQITKYVDGNGDGKQHIKVEYLEGLISELCRVMKDRFSRIATTKPKLSEKEETLLRTVYKDYQETANVVREPEPEPEPESGGQFKVNIKNIMKQMKKIRKHIGIVQTGINKGKLKKEYKYSGKKSKTGLQEIIKKKPAPKKPIKKKPAPKKPAPKKPTPKKPTKKKPTKKKPIKN